MQNWRSQACASMTEKKVRFYTLMMSQVWFHCHPSTLNPRGFRLSSGTRLEPFQRSLHWSTLCSQEASITSPIGKSDCKFFASARYLHQDKSCLLETCMEDGWPDMAMSVKDDHKVHVVTLIGHREKQISFTPGFRSWPSAGQLVKNVDLLEMETSCSGDASDSCAVSRMNPLCYFQTAYDLDCLMSDYAKH